jgi:hypothetical protein
MTYSANMTVLATACVRRGRLSVLCMGTFLAVSAAASTTAVAQNNAEAFAGVATLLKQRTDPGPAADFVERSRPAGLGYIPAHAPRSEPTGKALNRDQIKALEAELDAARARHDKIARRGASAQPLRSAAGNPYVAPKKKQAAKCVLTCEIK